MRRDSTSNAADLSVRARRVVLGVITAAIVVLAASVTLTAVTPSSVRVAGPDVDADDLPGLRAQPSPAAWHATSAVIDHARHTTIRWRATGRLRIRARREPGVSGCDAVINVTAGPRPVTLAVTDGWKVIDGPAITSGDLLTLAAPGCAIELDWVSVHVAGWSAGTATALWDNPTAPIDENARDGDPVAQRYASVPTAVWLTDPATAPDVARHVVADATRAGQMPTFVIYAIPGRDCATGQSAGGATSGHAYATMIDGVAAAIGDTEAAVIVEPDALATDCGNRTERSDEVGHAAAVIAALPHSHVYLDAGHPGWLPAGQIADRLIAAGIAADSGFSVNVANFASPDAAERYGEQILTELDERGVSTGTLGMIVDVSRAGGHVGADEFCNPPGARLGPAPTLLAGSPVVDAWMWVKPPGESDGQCGTPDAPPAGTFWLAGLRSLAAQ